MGNMHGDFVWYELVTSDADAAQKFYAPLLGWHFESAGFDGNDYRSFAIDGAPIGGFLPLDEKMIEGGARPAWLGYVYVEDLDAALKKLKSAGGTVMMGSTQVPDVGPFAMVADPQAIPFYVIEDNSGEASAAFAKHEPREAHCAWNELVTTDPDGAKTFYGALFGWEKTDEMDLGEMGKYEMLSAGDYTLGAVMPKPDEMPAALWIHYFRVRDIDEAAAYIDANGGQLINGPMEIPGGDLVLNAIDPQGALFALIGKRQKERVR